MSGNPPLAPASLLPTMLDPVQVPPGFFPIEVVQYWRGEYVPGSPTPLHWVIIVRTSARRGNCHELVGNTNTFTTQDRFDITLHERGNWRGSHVIGYVSPARLDDLLNHIELVPVVRNRWTWNCQTWVYEALKGLNDPELLEAWEIGDI